MLMIERSLFEAKERFRQLSGQGYIAAVRSGKVRPGYFDPSSQLLKKRYFSQGWWAVSQSDATEGKPREYPAALAHIVGMASRGRPSKGAGTA